MWVMGGLGVGHEWVMGGLVVDYKWVSGGLVVGWWVCWRVC